jgi:hypothetical protein
MSRYAGALHTLGPAGLLFLVLLLGGLLLLATKGKARAGGLLIALAVLIPVVIGFIGGLHR